MILIAKVIVILFGFFLIGVGLLMLLKPESARGYLRKAGSTNLINYSEITVRMIPAAAMIIYADLSLFPEVFKLFGWFMIATSLVLYFVPRKLHHAYATKWADRIQPLHFQLISPFSMLFGCAIIYSVY